jgi:hypothetical protein
MATGLIRFLLGHAYIQNIGTAKTAVPKFKTNQPTETKMNKIALSLIALAAISTASFAGDNRNWDLRDAPTITGKFEVSAPSVSAFAVANQGSGNTNSDIIKRNMMTNESSSH